MPAALSIRLLEFAITPHAAIQAIAPSPLLRRAGGRRKAIAIDFFLAVDVQADSAHVQLKKPCLERRKNPTASACREMYVELNCG
ncbi:hypothetical protein ABZW96_35520 [Nocardia sp. NPDC004168]|uniref:hypothetical protein n=1 Tax=Nocardia TaxID=1817 RepID=UPI0033A58B2F